MQPTVHHHLNNEIGEFFCSTVVCSFLKELGSRKNLEFTSKVTVTILKRSLAIHIFCYKIIILRF